MNETSSDFLRACRGETPAVTPVWFMRQAGRFLPEYRAVRARTSFLNLCRAPARAAEVTVTAAERLGVDAAIIFSDILLPLEPLGLRVEFPGAGGPRVSPPVRSAAQVAALKPFDPAALGFLYEAVRQARAALPARVPLIGFCGAPFTLASYACEGGASRDFAHAKRLMLADPGAWRALLNTLAAAAAACLARQIDAGADAVQVFDSWVGCLSPRDYRRFVLPATRALVAAVGRRVPVIMFGVGSGLFLDALRETGADVIGVDARTDLEFAAAALPGTPLQGNLDPSALLAGRDVTRERARDILDAMAGRPHIFNLGHGVLPETDPNVVIDLVKFVHDYSASRDRTDPRP